MNDAASPPAATRWFQRVLPTTGVLVVVLGLVALVVPPVRHQVELSLTRQQDPYVELYFARSPADGGQAVCTRRGAKAVVRFVVASHLADAEKLPYTVVADPRKGSSRQVRGTVGTRPDEAIGTRVVLAVPARQRYSISVTLPDSGQQLTAHCPGRSS